MTNWTEGYHAGEDYNYEYHAELNPLRLHLALLNADLAPPTTLSACELGFGQGLSMNLHAAASTTQWFGTDFNPAHAVFAKELASASGAAASFSDQSFAEFCSRPDLPDFDFIGLHGVFSWISDENRGTIVNFINRKLKAGGVLYLSYNTLSGHAAFMPVQELLTRYVELHGASSRKLDKALEFAQKVLAASPLYTQANTQAAKELATISSYNRTYVAHEYINRAWTPMSFSRLAEWLAPTKLTYACTARWFDTIDEWNLTIEQQAVLNEIHDINLRETVRNLMMNRRLRKDYWIKGARRNTPQEKMEGLRRQRVVLGVPRSDVSVEAQATLGNFSPPKSVYDPILDALADHRPRTLGQIEQAVNDKGVDIGLIMTVVLALVQTGALFPAQEDSVVAAARPQTDKLNAFLCDRARYRVTQSVLVSPVIGSGIVDVGRVVQFFWHAMSQGKKSPSDLAAHASQIFRAEGMTILDEERLYAPPDGNLTALTAAATIFTDKMVPVLRGLQIL
jgi:SAM-dependent methyltransferase